MKLVTYNIRFGLGTDQRIDLGRIAETVRDGDIIGLQEVERFWKRSGMTDQPEILGQHLKGFYWVYCPVFDVDASERESDGTVINRRRQFGPMLLSRWPIRASRVNSLPKLGTVNHFNMDTGGIECVVDTPSGPLRFIPSTSRPSRPESGSCKSTDFSNATDTLKRTAVPGRAMGCLRIRSRPGIWPIKIGAMVKLCRPCPRKRS